MLSKWLSYLSTVFDTFQVFDKQQVGRRGSSDLTLMLVATWVFQVWDSKQARYKYDSQAFSVGYQETWPPYFSWYMIPLKETLSLYLLQASNMPPDDSIGRYTGPSKLICHLPTQLEPLLSCYNAYEGACKLSHEMVRRPQQLIVRSKNCHMDGCVCDIIHPIQVRSDTFNFQGGVLQQATLLGWVNIGNEGYHEMLALGNEWVTDIGRKSFLPPPPCQ